MSCLITTQNNDVDEINENEGRLWLYFAEATSINTIEDLENAAETWKQILHHFSRMPDASADSGRILQINKLSPLELELTASIALLTPLTFGIKFVLYYFPGTATFIVLPPYSCTRS